jgi:hypothetical protein
MGLSCFYRYKRQSVSISKQQRELSGGQVKYHDVHSWITNPELRHDP